LPLQAVKATKAIKYANTRITATLLIGLPFSNACLR
jgi:hypothetical protein